MEVLQRIGRISNHKPLTAARIRIKLDSSKFEKRVQQYVSDKQKSKKEATQHL